MNSNNVQHFHAVLVSLRFQNLYKLLTEFSSLLYLIAMVHGKYVISIIHRAQFQYGFQGFLWTMEEEEEDEPQEEPAEELEEVMLLDSEERR